MGASSTTEETEHKSNKFQWSKLCTCGAGQTHNVIESDDVSTKSRNSRHRQISKQRVSNMHTKTDSGCFDLDEKTIDLLMRIKNPGELSPSITTDGSDDIAFEINTPLPLETIHSRQPLDGPEQLAHSQTIESALIYRMNSQLKTSRNGHNRVRSRSDDGRYNRMTSEPLTTRTAPHSPDTLVHNKADGNSDSDTQPEPFYATHGHYSQSAANLADLWHTERKRGTRGSNMYRSDTNRAWSTEDIETLRKEMTNELSMLIRQHTQH